MASTEGIENWSDFLNRIANLSGEWIYRGGLATWKLETSLERACKHWNVQGDQLPAIERKMLREFKRHPEVRGLIGSPDDELEWLALMQHYGAPTRLLDWTYSPFSALHFALDNLLQSGTSNDNEDGVEAVVWAIRTKWFDELIEGAIAPPAFKMLQEYKKNRGAVSFKNLFIDANSGAGFVYPVNPMHLNERLSEQQGVFLCPGDISQTFAANLAKLGSLDDKANARSFIFTRRLMPECFNALNRMNVSARTLYRGLPGYAQSLKHRIPHLQDDFA